MSIRFQCPGCGYIYDEELGDSHEGYSPGTSFEDLPDNFTCPDCAVCAKGNFIKLGDN